ncbi:P13 family porin [Borreliella tanukii]|uniref:P13 family porin n=1 Tax=Borreliella tanukii TaxID=56146 RepID=UPI003B20F1EE
MKLILIFGLTIQIFATKDKPDRIEKSVASSLQYDKYIRERINPLVPLLLNLFLFLGIVSFIREDYIGSGTVSRSSVIGRNPLTN